MGVPAFPPLTSRELTEDAHLEARGFFSRLPHPEVGTRVHGGIPWRLHHGANGVRRPAPLLGADTEDVLGNLLEMPAGEIARLRKRGVLE